MPEFTVVGRWARTVSQPTLPPFAKVITEVGSAAIAPEAMTRPDKPEGLVEVREWVALAFDPFPRQSGAPERIVRRDYRLSGTS
jgi:hypothetical protein